MTPQKYIILLLLSVSIVVKGQTKIKSKPNVLMILVDDFGWRDIHAYGSDFYETPNMDKLISQSLKFNQAYSSYPRCVPSRYSIMTGSHPGRKKGDGEGGSRDGESGFSIIKPNISIGQAMKDNGYYTFYIGKWHLGAKEYAPLGVGFDTSIAAGEAGATSSHFAPYNLSKGGTSGKEQPIPDLEDAPIDENLEDRLTEETIKLIKGAPKNKPFFGVLAHYAVHTPIQGKQEYTKYFKEKLAKMGLPKDNGYEKESAGENKLYQDNATYAAMIKSVDDGVGKIIEILEKRGLSKNTIIIVTSDHGGLSSRGNKRELATSNRPLRAGKGNLYEGGIRVPLFVKWPDVVKPGETNTITQGIDHFPTLIEIAGGKIPKEQLVDGISYLSILKGGSPNLNRTLFWHNMAPRPMQTADVYSSAIRKGDFKLVDLYAQNKQELFNLKDDVGEHKDLSKDNPALVQQLYKELKVWRKEIGADMKIKPNSLSEDEKKVFKANLSPQEIKEELKREERQAIKEQELKEVKKSVK